MSRPFREALDFHRSRVPMSSAAASKLSAEARSRALYSTALARQASAVEMHRILDEMLRGGQTPAYARAEIAKRISANGGALLSPARQNLIIQQNVGLAYSSGRIAQMRDPDVLKTRPIWMYPLGPHDTRTTQVCIDLEGFMAPADSDVWNHVAPPNHYNERHLQLLSLTVEQAEKRGKVFEAPEGGGEYPVIDGKSILPDAGFDMHPALLDADAQSLAEEFAALSEQSVATTAADYELEAIADVVAEELAELPELDPVESAEEGWDALRALLGMPDELESTIAADVFGDGVIVNRGSFDAIFADAPELVELLPAMLSDPEEVWFVPMDASDGTVMVKRYIAGFKTDDGGSLWMWADQSPEGWIARGGVAASTGEIEELRKGFLGRSRLTSRPAKGGAK